MNTKYTPSKVVDTVAILLGVVVALAVAVMTAKLMVTTVFGTAGALFCAVVGGVSVGVTAWVAVKLAEAVVCGKDEPLYVD